MDRLYPNHTPAANPALIEPLSAPLAFSHKVSSGNASYTYHRHDGCEVFLFLSGHIRFYVEQTCYEPVPGSLIILNHNEMHRVESIDESPYERIVVNVKRSYLEHLSTPDHSLADCFYNRARGTENLRVLSPEAVKEFMQLFQDLSRSREPGCYGASILQNSYAALLFLWVGEQFRTSGLPVRNTMPPYVSGVMRYLADHPEEPLSLDLLSAEFHVSATYLSAQFKRHTGLTLRSYQLDLKVGRAKELLESGATVTEACYGSGFRDYANFLRSFKHITGTSPGKYAKQA